MLARWNGLWKARVRMFPDAKHIEQAPECLRCTPRSIHTIGVSHILHPRESVSSFRAALLVGALGRSAARLGGLHEPGTAGMREARRLLIATYVQAFNAARMI